MAVGADAIAELHPASFGAQRVVDLFGEGLGEFHGKIAQGQAGDDRTHGFPLGHQFADVFTEFAGVAIDDMDSRKSFFYHVREFLGHFNRDEMVRAHAAVEDGFGDDAGAGAELDDVFIGSGEPIGHGTAEARGTGGDSADALAALTITQPFVDE